MATTAIKASFPTLPTTSTALKAATQPFVPRTQLPSYTLPKSYYLGHHAAGLTRMRQLLASNISLVLECRDFRIPLTSRNPLLEDALSSGGERKKRIIVYTKLDLGSSVEDRGREVQRVMSRLRGKGSGRPASTSTTTIDGSTSAPSPPNAINEEAETTFFFTAHGTGHAHTSNAPALLKLIKSHARSPSHFSLTGTRILVAGMPNVGKSTLLNALRSAGAPVSANGSPRKRSKVAATGGMPGVTRSVGSAVKILEGWEVDGLKGPPERKRYGLRGATTAAAKMTEAEKLRQAATKQGQASAGSEPVYIHDTPGVFMPYVPSALNMLKLALCGCVKDGLVPPLTVADYLLYELNLRDPQMYLHLLRPKPKAQQETRAKARTTTIKTTPESKAEAEAEAEVSDSSKETKAKTEKEPQPTNNILTLLKQLAARTGRLSKGGEPDLEATAVWFVQQWRRGELGRFVLDDVYAASTSDREAAGGNRGSGGGIVIRDEDASREGMVSVSQARKAEKEMRREAGRVRRRKA